MKLAVIPQGCPAVIVNRRKYLVQTNHVFCNAALYNPIHINTAAFVKASLPVTVTWPKEFPQRLVPNHKQKQQKKMKRTILSLVLGAALLCGCNPQQLCQDTAVHRTAAIKWDEIPTYATRGCKVPPGQNRFNPLWQVATGPNKEAGQVYFKIEILEDCKNDNWYNWYYWQNIWGYHADVLIPENKRFRLTIEYRESCLADCYFPTHFTSAIFRSQQIFEPGTWKASDLQVLNTPQYVSEDLPCAQ